LNSAARNATNELEERAQRLGLNVISVHKLDPREFIVEAPEVRYLVNVKLYKDDQFQKREIRILPESHTHYELELIDSLCSTGALAILYKNKIIDFKEIIFNHQYYDKAFISGLVE